MADERPFDYDIAISYAGPDRWVAEELVGYLTNRQLRVFYDRDELAQIVGKNLVDVLTDLYQNRARLCVILISAHYTESGYTDLERQAAQARAMRESGYIFPIKLDPTDLPGMPDTVAFIDWHAFEPDQIADLICEKLQQPGSSVAVSQYARRGRNLRHLTIGGSSAEQIVDFEEEIALFQDMLEGNAPPILFIQDDSGTGKTTLLYKYMEVCEAWGILCSFVDFKGGYQSSSEKVLEVIAKQTGVIPVGASIEEFLSSVDSIGSSESNHRVVLLLDAFNWAMALESWIVDRLLIPIHRGWIGNPIGMRVENRNLIVVIAGWQVPALPPGEGEWEESVTRLWKLPRWGQEQIREFGEALGWPMDEERVHDFLLCSNGEPHVCSLIIRRYYRNVQEGRYE
jgi:hypothetical protein